MVRWRTRAAGRLAGAAVVGTLLVSGCSVVDRVVPGDGDPVPQAGGTLTLLTERAAPVLDPARALTATDVLLTTRLLHRTLTTFPAAAGQAGTDVVADLAEDLGSPSKDGLTWTFRLKQGMTYADGAPIRAADFVHGVSRTFAPGLDDGLPYPGTVLADTEGYQGPYGGAPLPSVTAPDDRTVVYRLREPIPDFAAVVATPQFAPVPADRDPGPSPARGAAALPTSGPYQLAAADSTADRLVVTRNPGWRRDEARLAYPDAVVVETGVTAATRDRRLIEADGDDSPDGAAVSLDSPADPRAIAAIVNDPARQARAAAGLTGSLTYLAVNTRAEPFTDLRVRQALQYAVNRKAVQDAAGGTTAGGDQTTTILTPVIPGRRGHDQYDAGPTGDPDRARALLDLAALPPGTRIPLAVRADQRSLAVAGALVQAFRESGLSVTVDVRSDEDFLATVTTPSRQPPLALVRWQPDWPSGAAVIPPLFDSRSLRESGNTNLSQLASAPIDAQIDVATGTEPADARDAAWSALDRTVMGLAPVVPLLSDRGLFLAGPQVGNLFVHYRYGLPDPAAMSARLG